MLGVVPAACVPGLAPCPAEVAAIFTVPLATFLGAAGHMHRDVPWVHGPAPGVRFRLHYFEHGELGPIWRVPWCCKSGRQAGSGLALLLPNARLGSTLALQAHTGSLTACISAFTP